MNCVLDCHKWDENTSQFNKDFTENCNEDSGKEYFLVVDVPYPQRLSPWFTIFTWKTDN